MKVPLFQVDAFTNKVFGGNPAAVCPLPRWLPDEVMQRIAMENAVAETAFFVPLAEGYEIRWFTPEIEMDLCGHATLAAAHVLARHLDPSLHTVRFQSKSGELRVEIEERFLTLDFPSRPPEPSEAPQPILDAMPHHPIAGLEGTGLSARV